MHIGLLLFEIMCIWSWQSKSLTWNLQPLSCGINIYIYVLAERSENRCFDLVNAHRAATVWNSVQLKLTLKVANLRPTAFILWYIYIYLMFCWRSEKQELGTLSNRFISLLKSLEPLNSESPACLETYMSGNNQSSVGGEGVSHMDKHSC